MAILFGAVADDDTGATDLAGMLAEQGVRTILAIDLPTQERLAALAADCQALVVGVASRALTAAEAYARTRAAVRSLHALGPRTIQIKYCSTFDSTADGNIGPSIDAALDELGESLTVAVPALPVNGRTTYMGHHFVGQQLLSDSPMRRHPLTPMTESNLVVHLQRQTARKVGLAPSPVVRAGAARLRGHLDQLRSAGVQIAIVDCISDDDLEAICEAVHDLPVLSGGSGLAIKLPAVWRRQSWLPAGENRQPSAADSGKEDGPSGPSGRPHRSPGRGFLVVAGSCSTATARQNEWLLAQGARQVVLDGMQLIRGDFEEEAVVQAVAGQLQQGATCLVRTAAAPEDVRRVHQWAGDNCRTEAEAGVAIGARLAALVRQIVGRSPPAGLLIAGGETSGAICRALGLDALHVGANVEPGVPLCFPLGKPSVPVVLKSGNFGSDDFYGRAIAAMDHHRRDG